MGKASRRRAEARQQARPETVATPPGGSDAGLVHYEGRMVPWADLAHYLADARGHFEQVEQRIVWAARRAGCSWDRISLELGGRPSGERLRQKYRGDGV